MHALLVVLIAMNLATITSSLVHRQLPHADRTHVSLVVDALPDYERRVLVAPVPASQQVMFSYGSVGAAAGAADGTNEIVHTA